ncbi:MAG: HTTM domain-containing protein [Verrucomicrobiales bacterium]|nr:HTTM domain-containing protein [Verrucomicrobiales bacterium]
MANLLLEPANPKPLGAFRILWGMILLLECWTLVKCLEDIHNVDYFHFTARGVSFVEHLSPQVFTTAEVVILIVCALLVTLGLWFRWAALLFTIGYTHLLLAEAAKFNNHFYLLSLITLLLCFTAADRSFSCSKKNGKLPTDPIPFWHYAILRLQVAVIYFFGGIAKLETDWLIVREPVRFWMNHSPTIVASIKAISYHEWFVFLIAWGGLFIDLLCPFLLMFRKTRIVAFVVLIGFHLLNSQMFLIGNFPMMGILVLLLFVPVRRGGQEIFLGRLFRSRDMEEARKFGMPGKWMVSILAVYFILQFLFPLRGLLHRPRNPSWTDTGHLFSWRMMLIEKPVHLHFYYDLPGGLPPGTSASEVYPKVAPYASIFGSRAPHMIWQFVQGIKKNLARKGYLDVPIYVYAVSSLNGRPFQPLIDPNVNMAEVEVPAFGIPDWVTTLQEYDGPRYYPTEKSEQELAVYEAMKDWFEKNPGPGAKFLYRIRPGSPDLSR